MTSPAPTNAPAPSSPARWKTLLVLALIFVCGGASGWALRGAARGSWGGPSGMRRPPFGQEEFAAHLRRRFSRELSLTEAQQAAVVPALDRAAGAMTEARRAGEQRARAAIEALHTELRPLLTEDQAKKLDELRQRHRRDGPPPP